MKWMSQNSHKIKDASFWGEQFGGNHEGQADGQESGNSMD